MLAELQRSAGMWSSVAPLTCGLDSDDRQSEGLTTERPAQLSATAAQLSAAHLSATQSLLLLSVYKSIQM